MKKLLLLFIALMFFACKKEKPEPEPTPTPAPAPAISVKINGTAFSCSGCTSSYKSGGMHGVNFHIPNTQDRLLFSFNDFPGTGNFTLVKNGDPSIIYQKNNVYYKAVNGSLNITGIDTSANGTITKLICTFNCNTDTTANIFYSFTEGATNL